MILRDAIERYVLWRRAHGAKFTTGTGLLRQEKGACHCWRAPGGAAVDGLLGSDRVGLDRDGLILRRSLFLGHGRFAAIRRRLFAAGSTTSVSSASVASTATARAQPGVRSGSGSQPVPASSVSAFSAISPFLRWSISFAACLPLASRTACRMRVLVTRPR